jgi:hypothetical protein
MPMVRQQRGQKDAGKLTQHARNGKARISLLKRSKSTPNRVAENRSVNLNFGAAMSDALKDFFRKYDAVPATDRGPVWSEATDEALIGQLQSMASALRFNSQARATPSYVREFEAAAQEAWTRIARLAEECGRQPADRPGRDTVGKLLACVSVHCGSLLTVKYQKS